MMPDMTSATRRAGPAARDRGQARSHNAARQARSHNVAANDEARWQALVRRDRAADGTFYVAVRTTGIYCRPSCTSRRPLRENVRFFDDRASAERAGFRACKRCRPDGPTREQETAARIARACRAIESASDALDFDAIAAQIGMSRSHFQRTFKHATGLTPRAYAAAHREGKVRALLPKTARVTDAVYAAGFGSSGRFYERADRALGMRPQQFRSGGSDAAIRFAVGECSLGSILVAASERGVCAILLGDDPDALVHELERDFPNAALAVGDREFERWVAAVVGFVEEPRIGLDLPLDVRGTAFQQRVWQALQAIPPGSTASYADIAKKIGAPSAARAVAAACAANVLAVAIPCHRVIRRDGALSGYRFGVERKRTLLARESRR